MKKTLHSLGLALVLSLAVLSGCVSQDAPSGSASAVPSTPPAAVDTLYNPAFSIEPLRDGIKKVLDGEGRELILVPKALDQVPQQYADSIVIRTPVDNAVFLSSTQVCSFRAVQDAGLIDAIAGVSGGIDTWAGLDPIVQAMEQGSIVDVGGTMGDPDYELIQSLEPELVFVYTGSSPQTSQIAKFEELGIPYAVDNEYMESNYMARMEWLRFVLTFFDADEAADEAMRSAQQTVSDLKAAVSGQDQPRVAVFNVFDGTVYGTSKDSWVGTMLADLGGINVFDELPAGPLTMEAAFQVISDADLIIYTSTPTWCSGLEGIQDQFPLLSQCRAYQSGRVFQYGEPFWLGIDQTHQMAADLAAVFYPQLFPDRALTYYVPLSA